MIIKLMDKLQRKLIEYEALKIMKSATSDECTRNVLEHET